MRRWAVREGYDVRRWAVREEYDVRRWAVREGVYELSIHKCLILQAI